MCARKMRQRAVQTAQPCAPRLVCLNIASPGPKLRPVPATPYLLPPGAVFSCKAHNACSKLLFAKCECWKQAADRLQLPQSSAPVSMTNQSLRLVK